MGQRRQTGKIFARQLPYGAWFCRGNSNIRGAYRQNCTRIPETSSNRERATQHGTMPLFYAASKFTGIALSKGALTHAVHPVHLSAAPCLPKDEIFPTTLLANRISI